jgi:hypothetical protein
MLRAQMAGSPRFVRRPAKFEDPGHVRGDRQGEISLTFEIPIQVLAHTGRHEAPSNLGRCYVTMGARTTLLTTSQNAAGVAPTPGAIASRTKLAPTLAPKRRIRGTYALILP